MPPKPALPSEDMVTRHERAVQMETKVRGLLHHGALRQAQRAFDADWEHTLLPHLPLRHAFLLERLDRKGIARFLEALKDKDSVKLRLLPGVDRRRPDQIGVGLHGEDSLIGFLPPDALDVVSGAGEYAELYEPKILAVRGIQAGADLRFEMELARPDLRQCSACATLHTGDHENCDECRAKRRRKKKSLEETAEVPSVPVVNAFNHLARAAVQAREV